MEFKSSLWPNMVWVEKKNSINSVCDGLCMLYSSEETFHHLKRNSHIPWKLKSSVSLFLQAILSDLTTCSNFSGWFQRHFQMFLVFLAQGKEQAKVHTQNPPLTMDSTPWPSPCMPQNEMGLHWKRKGDGGGILQAISGFLLFFNKES